MKNARLCVKRAQRVTILLGDEKMRRGVFFFGGLSLKNRTGREKAWEVPWDFTKVMNIHKRTKTTNWMGEIYLRKGGFINCVNGKTFIKEDGARK